MPAKAAKFLDSNAGAPLRPEVVAALSRFISSQDNIIANSSSIHSFGRKSKRFMAEAREHVASSLGKKTDPEQLVFTSSGTEANQLAIRSVLEPLLNAGSKPHWITTPVEHDSVLQAVKWFETRGGSVSYLPVDAHGRPDSSALSNLIQKNTALVSVIWVNNETGVISDVETLSSVTRLKGVRLHLDAAQAWGKLPIDLSLLGADYVTFSGHKIGALAGTGILWVGRGCPVTPVILGKQEKGRRGGTENLMGIVALGAATCSLDLLKWDNAVRPLREYLESAICSRISGVQINGAAAPRVGNTTSLSFEGIEGEGLVLALDMAGFAVSAGSACSSGVLEPSHVLMAMGRSKSEALASIRVSLKEDTRREDLDAFVSALSSVVARMRNPAPAFESPIESSREAQTKRLQ